MELVEEAKELLRETAQDLKGSKRRLFRARTVRGIVNLVIELNNMLK